MAVRLCSESSRRSARARSRRYCHPWLEELEPRTVLAVGAAGLPAALAVPTTPAQEAIVSAPPAAAQHVLNAGLGQLPVAPPGASPAPPVTALTTQPPAALSPNSTAPLSVLSYSGYQLTSGLNPALAAGQLPTGLNTPAVNALFEVGGNTGEGPTPAPASTGNMPVVPLGALLNVAPPDDQ